MFRKPIRLCDIIVCLLIEGAHQVLDTHLPVGHAAPDYDQLGIIYVMSGFFEELQRWVYRVALGGAVVAWLVIQISATVMPPYHAREWILPIFITAVVLNSKAHS
jgi:hypothetical protein